MTPYLDEYHLSIQDVPGAHDTEDVGHVGGTRACDGNAHIQACAHVLCVLACVVA